MIAELGHYALMLALGLSLIQGTMPIVGARHDDPTLLSVAAPAALAQFVFVALSFGAIAVCNVTSHFTLLNVYENSNKAIPLMYRLTSNVWGNHEGSMMLWVFILALFGARVAAFGGNLPAKLRANALAVQAWIAAALQLSFSPPRIRSCALPMRQFEGRDLNPTPAGSGVSPFTRRCSVSAMSASSKVFSFAIAALLEAPHRCRLGALGVWPWALPAPGCASRSASPITRLILGLLRARLGRLLVLGSSGKCFG